MFDVFIKSYLICLDVEDVIYELTGGHNCTILKVVLLVFDMLM